MTRDDPSTVLAILGDGALPGIGGDAPLGMRTATATQVGIFPPVRTGDAKRDAENRRAHTMLRFMVPDDSALGLLEWESRADRLPAIQAEAARLFFDSHPDMAAMFQKPDLPAERAMPETDIIYTPLRRH